MNNDLHSRLRAIPDDDLQRVTSCLLKINRRVAVVKSLTTSFQDLQSISCPGDDNTSQNLELRRLQFEVLGDVRRAIEQMHAATCSIDRLSELTDLEDSEVDLGDYLDSSDSDSDGDIPTSLGSLDEIMQMPSPVDNIDDAYESSDTSSTYLDEDDADMDSADTQEETMSAYSDAEQLGDDKAALMRFLHDAGLDVPPQQFEAGHNYMIKSDDGEPVVKVELDADFH